MKTLHLFLFYVSLGIILWGIQQTNLSVYLHQNIDYILVFFVFLSYLNKLLFEIGWKNGREKLIHYMMGIQAFRFISSLIFIGIFAFLKINNIYIFVGNFFVLYLFSTNFEIITLLRKLRRDFKK